jgi:hypothetical protein
MSNLTRILNASVSIPVADGRVFEHAKNYLSGNLAEGLNQPEPWASLSMLWPPRLVGAVKERRAAAFFGAGMSLAAGAPSWGELLSKNFRLGEEVLQDRDLGDDPLTLAQLAAEQIGYEKTQQILREVMGGYSDPTTSHLLLAALRLPYYITTNYDTLFEAAWEKVFPRDPLKAVVVNDLDLAALSPGAGKAHESVLLKIHGCVRREKEQLILTRRDYRTHYRANDKFFNLVRRLLREYHILFLGFSHKDPEVARLVEDVIYDYEKGVRSKLLCPAAPHFYSLQFDMRSHSPEVFAARGIVALKPPIVPTTTGDSRSLALATAICDLDAASAYDLHHEASLDVLMHECLDEFTQDLDRALSVINSYLAKAIETIDGGAERDWLGDAIRQMGELSGQGIWLIDEEGKIIDYELPFGLSRVAREEELKSRAKKAKRAPAPNGRGWLDDRPYFRAAKTFQEPFVSDVFQSIFNGHGTVFFCQPLINEGSFRGLLFAAAQVGTWKKPISLSERCLFAGRQLIIVDSNGVLLVPSVGDHENKIVPSVSTARDGGEEPNCNVGFPFSRLLELSRRDSLVAHIANNIVPVSQDDDIMVLSSDLKQYSVISEVRRSRLKLAVTRAIG